MPNGLRFIQRNDLANLLTQHQQASAERYYQGCIERWSGTRYALDKRFVQLTLLLDQGEAAQGPRWQVSARFQELSEVLARVPHQALVLLGPPGSGKSTLLRHYELDCARSVLDGSAEAERDQAPLTFFIPLNDYKARRKGDPLPLPGDWLAERWSAAYPNLPSLDTLLRERFALFCRCRGIQWTVSQEEWGTNTPPASPDRGCGRPGRSRGGRARALTGPLNQEPPRATRRESLDKSIACKSS